MKNLFPIVLSALLTASASQAAIQGTCRADFDVKATMDSFIGHADSEPIQSDPNQPDTLTVVFPIANLKTGKDKRDAEMRHMFDSENHPLLSGSASLKDLMALPPVDEGSAEASADRTLPVQMSIHGITNEVTAKITNLSKGPEGITFDAAIDILLPDYTLKPPSVLGLIRVNKKVAVTAHFELAEQ